MRIKSSNVPPEVWARNVRGNGAPNEKDRVLLNAWENSRQIYRFSEALWNVVDWDCGRDCSAAGLALKHLPYSCVFVQHEDAFKVSVSSLGNQRVAGGSWYSDFSESINVKGFFCSPVSLEDGSVGVRVDALYNQSMELTSVDAMSGERKVLHRDCGLCISHTEYSAADLRSGIGSLTCKKQARCQGFPADERTFRGGGLRGISRSNCRDVTSWIPARQDIWRTPLHLFPQR